jgi:sugar fermentation stimulation protein A
MRFDFVTEPATFLARPNRYRVDARLHACGTQVAAHCADPGRLRELLIPGVTVHVSPAGTRLPGLPARKAARKTAWDLRFVEHPAHGQLVSLDTRVPNRIFRGLRGRLLPALARRDADRARGSPARRAARGAGRQRGRRRQPD